MFSKSVIILVVSRDILEGAVLDRNAAFLSARVDNLGYRVRTIQVVDRVESEITAAIHWAMEQKPSFLIVTGGLGPSLDDNSRACAAKAIGLPLREDAEALEYVQNSYRRLYAKGVVDSAELTEERRRMAMVPAGSECHENPIGTGPAVKLTVGETTLFLLPGVPAEMQRLFQYFVEPALSQAAPDTLRKQRVVDYYGYDESAVTRLLEEVKSEHDQVEFRTRIGGIAEDRVIRITLVAEHHDANQLESVLEQAEQHVRRLLGAWTNRRPGDAGRVNE